MTFAFHLELYDPPVAARKGKPGDLGYSFDGLTMEQCETAQRYLGVMLRKLAEWKEREMGLTKHGTGDVIREPTPEHPANGPRQAKAKGPWSTEDEEELARELADE